MLTHTAIFSQVADYSQAIGITPGDRIASWLPLYHDLGFIACFLMPMILGCPVVHRDAFAWSARPTLLLDDIVSFDAQYVWLPNFALNHIANGMRAGQSWDLVGLRSIIVTSEPCRPATLSRFCSMPQLEGLRPTALQASYGMAENVLAVTQTDVSSVPRVVRVDAESARRGTRIALASDGVEGIEVLSCGRPLARTMVAIADEAGERIGEDLRLGEILVRGSSLYSGYYRRPELTAERLVEGWHRTGDLGFLIDGELYVTGRMDDLLVIRGRNLYAHEVEDLVNTVEDIIPGRAVALAVHDNVDGDASLVVLAECNDLSRGAEIERAVRTVTMDALSISLGDFRLFPPRSLRKTTSGKLSRNENIALYREACTTCPKLT